MGASASERGVGYAGTVTDPHRRGGPYGIALATFAAATLIVGCSHGPPEGAVEADLNVYWDAVWYYGPVHEGDWEEKAVVIEYRLECGQSLNSAQVLSETDDSVDIAVWIDEGPCESSTDREVWAGKVDIRLQDPLNERSVSGFGEPLPEGYYRNRPFPLDFINATGEGLDGVLGPDFVDTYFESHAWIDIRWSDSNESIGLTLDALLRPTQYGHGEVSIVMVPASSLSEVIQRSNEMVDLSVYGLELFQDRFDSVVWSAGIDPNSGHLVAVPTSDGEYYLVVPAAYDVYDPSFDARCVNCEAEASDSVEWIVDQLTPATT